jgi:Flp pilus assembly pilin Flp
MRQIFRRLLTEQTGQDLVEYGLLASIIAIAGVALFPSIQERIGEVFTEWGTAVYNVWIPNDPAS